MTITRQSIKTERRVIVTLLLHERGITASEIIAKLKKSQTHGDAARECGALVRYNRGKDSYEFLYIIRPEQLLAKK